MLETLEHVAAGIGLFLLLVTPLVEGLQIAADRYSAHAAETPQPEDDVRAEKVQSVVGKIVVGLEHATRWLPVIKRAGRTK